MKSEIKERNNNKKEIAITLYFFRFFCLHIFGTYAKSLKHTHDPNFAKELSFQTGKTISCILATL